MLEAYRWDHLYQSKFVHGGIEVIKTVKYDVVNVPQNSRKIKK